MLGLEGTLGSAWLMYIFYRETKEAMLPKITLLVLTLTSQLQPLVVMLEDWVGGIPLSLVGVAGLGVPLE